MVRRAGQAAAAGSGRRACQSVRPPAGQLGCTAARLTGSQLRRQAVQRIMQACSVACRARGAAQPLQCRWHALEQRRRGSWSAPAGRRRPACCCRHPGGPLAAPFAP